MKILICSVYDRVAQIYGYPNFVNSKGATIRAFADQINRQDANSQLYQHPDDFDMYYLGEFDDATAEFTILPTPELLARGSHVKIQSTPADDYIAKAHFGVMPAKE